MSDVYKQLQRRLIQWQTECYLAAGNKINRLPGFATGRRLDDLTDEQVSEIRENIGADWITDTVRNNAGIY